MRKFYFLLLTVLFAAITNAQLTGTKTIPGDYATVAAAVTDLNAQGVGAGGVTFNVAAGHTETTDVPEITATGTLANPIIFQKSGAGANPLLTRLTAGTVASSTTLGNNGDGIIIINGGDYITFDGISLQTDAAFTAAGMMEYGYYLKKASATDACKNVTIKNCAITLNRAAIYSFGIFVSNISGTATVTVTSTGGRSENIKLHGNTITNSYGGIQLRGFAAATPFDFYDQNIEVGVDGANNISNYGGGATTAYGIYCIYQNNLTIANNTINNTANGGTPPTTTLYGIFLSTGTNSTATVRHNTITITAGSTTSAVYAINSGMGASGTSNTISIHNNTVTGCSYPTATSGDLYLIYQSTTPNTVHIYNNTLTGNSITSTSGTLYCIYQSGSVVTEGRIYGNTITGNTKTGTGVMYGIYNSPAATSTNDIYDNTISGNSGAGTLQGIYQGAGLVTNIYRNQIFNQSSSGATGIVNGMTVISGPLTTNIFNNFISDLKSPDGDAAADAVRGINITSTTANSSINLDYNSIYLNATSSGVNFSTSGVFHTYSATATSGSLTMRNNIVVNVSTPNGTGIVSAFRRSAATSLNNFNLATNNNDYYAGVPSPSRVIYYDGTNADQTLSAYITRVTPRDVNAISELPAFINVAVTPYNLHINTATPTQLESGGTPVAGITADFDGNSRNATTPDIGADEFTGISADLTAPAIAYSAFTNTLCLNNRTLSPVTITDPGSGVNIAPGTRPRLYFKKTTNTNTFNDNTSATNGWKYVEATGAGGSPFSFTTNYSLINGGVALGDIIQYFVVAQDLATTPNVGINSGTFATTPTSVALTAAAFPIGGTINQYSIPNTGLSTDVTIGAAGTYPTLTGAGGLFAAINSGGLLNNITARILDGAITEDGTNSLNGILYGCAGPYTLLIKPDVGVTTVLSGTGATALINLDGADNVTFDGSNNGTSSKNMTIRNLSTTGPVIRFINDATNNTVKNTIVEGAVTSTTSGLILFSTSTGTSGNSNNTIMNNDIRDRSDATAVFANSIYSSGTALAANASNIITGNNLFNFNSSGINLATTGLGNNWQLTNNNIYNAQATASAVTQNGILITAGTGHTITGNFVGGNAAGATGLWTNTGNVSLIGISITGGVATISNNTIANITSTNTGTTVRTRGISHTSTGDNIVIDNNDIFNLASFGAVASYTAGSQPVIGIYAFPPTDFHTYTVSNNEIHDLSAENTSALATSNLACGIELTNFTGECFRNKIYNIRNKSTGTTAGQPPIACGIYGRFMAAGSVYNNFISLGFGESNNVQYNGVIIVGAGTAGNTQFHSFNSIRIGGTATGTFSSHGFVRGDNSATSPSHPVILNNNILSMERTGGGSVNYAIASQGAGAAVDWTSNYNDLYNSNAANIGFWNATGYDFANWKITSGGDANSVSVAPLFVSTTDLHLTNAVGDNWCLNGSGIVIPGITTDIDGNTRSAGVAPLGPDIGADEFVAAGNAVATPSSQTICSGTTITTIVLSGTATSFNWTRDNTVAVTGIANSGTGNISGSLTNTTASPVTVTFTVTPVDASGCFGPSITATVLVNPNNSITLTSGAGTDAQTVCVNTAITNITYSTTGATGANFSGLPAGVNGNWAANVVTISGTPTALGVFSYTITLTGGCGTIIANGSITVIGTNGITLSSGAGTDAQIVCINTPITNITYNTTGATGANFSGLPAGVNGNWAANVITISGTPTASGVFNYTVTLTGGCGVVTANGSITVNLDNTITLSSAPGTDAQTVCINTAITNITYNTTGATGANFSGLPAGVNGNWAANVVTISGTPTVAGVFNYTVTLTGGCGVITANGSITVTAAPSATISYTGSPYCTSAGTATVTQTGTAGGTYSSTAGLTINPANGDVTLGTSTPGTYTVTYTIAASGGCPIYTTTTNITVNSCATSDLSITKTDGVTTYTPGGTTTYTIVASNAGPDGSVSAIVTDNFPAAITSVSWTAVYAGGATGPANGVGNINASVNLPTGSSATFTAVCNISAGASGNLVNTATITVPAGDTDPTPGNNTATDTDTENIPQADLSITKTDGVITVVPGTSTTYVITVGNAGPDNVTGASVTDIFPAAITSATWTAVYAGGATGPANGVGNINASVNLPTGSSATFTVTCNISASATGTLVNTATVTTPAGTADPNAGNNSATDVDVLTPFADLSITKTDGVTTYIPGGTTTYTIVVFNSGPSSVTGAIITDNFPADITGVSWTAVYAGGATGAASGSGNINELVNIPAGGSVTFTAVCSISPSAVGNLSNTATITAPAGTTDPTPLNNSATDSDIPAPPTITVTGTLTPFTTCAGTPSAEQTFTVSGINLSTNLVITAPVGFEISTTSGSGFSGTISLTPVGGNVSTTTIYVRLSAAASGTPSGNITCASTGAATQNVAVSGIVNPVPTATATPSSQTRCSGVAITTIVLSSSTPGTTYAWTRDNVATVTGIAANGSGNISGTLTNTTTAPITVTFTITPTTGTCTGPTTTATVLVNPTPNVVGAPTSQTICSGTAITPIALSGNVAGTTYTWTRTNTVNITGMAASGSGTPITGTLTNTTNTIQTTTFTITPSANGCTGPSITATVTVNPNATVNAVANRTVCNGTVIPAINFTSPTLGGTIVYNWTNSNTGIGLGASGTGNLPSFTATNATTAMITGTITVTPIYTNVVSCVGTPMTFTISVAPTSTVDPVPNQTVCANTLTAPVNFTSPVAGTTFAWTNNTTSIGLAASGTGNIPAFTALNATSNPVTATVTVTPSFTIGAPGSITLPPQGATFTGNVRGYWFTAPTSFTMTSLFVPTDASSGNQSIAVVRFNPAVPPPVFPGTTNAFTTLFVVQNGPAVGSIPVSIPIAAGDVIGIMGYRATVNSYTAAGSPVTTTIAGFPVSLTRMGMQFPLTTTLPQNIWQEPSVSSISRVLFDYSTGISCPGTPRTFTITVNPIPTITCPANMTVPTVIPTCTAPVTYAPTVTGTPAPTLSYTFSGATTGSGSGSGSGSLFNIGVTTVTITATNICGTVSCSFTITVTDSQTPVISTQPLSQSKCEGDNVTFTVVSTFASSYQWQTFTGGVWVNIPGTNAPSYTINNVTLAMNTNSYRVLITGPCGTVTTSNHATLTVNPVPVVVISASIPPILLPTDVLILTANTLPPPQPGGSFVWRKNGNIIAGATGSTLGPLTVNDVGSYTVTYTVNGCSGTSNILVVSAKPSDHFYVYPNPNFGQFQVRFYNQTNEQVTVTVYDAKGSQVYQRRITTTTPYTSLDVNLGNNPQGSYLVVVHNSANQVVGSQWVIVYH